MNFTNFKENVSRFLCVLWQKSETCGEVHHTSSLWKSLIITNWTLLNDCTYMSELGQNLQDTSVSLSVRKIASKWVSLASICFFMGFFFRFSYFSFGISPESRHPVIHRAVIKTFRSSYLSASRCCDKFPNVERLSWEVLQPNAEEWRKFENDHWSCCQAATPLEKPIWTSRQVHVLCDQISEKLIKKRGEILSQEYFGKFMFLF